MDDEFGFVKQELYGFGGCFIMILINLFGSIILSIIDVISNADVLSQIDTAATILCIASLIVNIGLSAVILVFIFKYNILFRTLFLIQTLIGFAFCFIIVFSVPGNADSIIVSLVLSILIRAFLTFYLYKSKRVNNTFVLKTQKATEENNSFL